MQYDIRYVGPVGYDAEYEVTPWKRSWFGLGRVRRYAPFLVHGSGGSWRYSATGRDLANALAYRLIWALIAAHDLREYKELKARFPVP